ncbi:MAG: pilus assembly protein CpaE [Sphingorhabdus sp.]
MNAPWKSGIAGARDPFTAYVCDDLTLDVVRTVCDDMGWAQEKAFKGGLRNAVQSLSVSASPQILLVDLSESGDPIADINSLAEVCEPGTVVIAMGQVNDVRLYRDLMMSGLQDYLLKPISPDALRDAVTHAQMVLNAPKHDDGSREHVHLSTAVIGTRGGVGASTIATSLAWLLSERMGHMTGFLDLDVHFGTGALALDLEPGRGLTDAIDNPSRIDGLFIERAMIKANEKLSILSAEAPINSPILTDGSAFFQLQEEFRLAFENTIIDLPRSMLIAYPHLLQDVNVVVIVCELTLASARDAIRLLAWLKSNAPSCQTIVVANRVQAGGLEISRKDFESSIERKIDLLIPFDPKATAQAAKLGKPIVDAARASKVSTGIVSLTDIIKSTGASEEPGEESKKDAPKKSMMGGFKSLLAKK